jgi:hypothetical protein
VPESATPPKRRAAQSAARKKAELQRAGLDAIESFLVERIGAGLGSFSDKNRESLAEQIARAGDADLSGPRDLLKRLAATLEEAPPQSDPTQEARNALTGTQLQPPRSASPEEKAARVGDLVARLWALVRKGKKVLDEWLASEESAPDAAVASMLGKRWQLSELLASGFAVRGVSLLELAHELHEDEITENVITTGHLLSLDTGDIWQEKTIIPFQALRAKNIYHRSSRAGVLLVKEAALYPGPHVNRRVRWNERDPEAAIERPRTAADYQRLHALARPLDEALQRYREQRKDPLAAQEAVFLLDAAKFGLLPLSAPNPGALVMEDRAGKRLVFRDPPWAREPTTETLAVAVAGHGPGSVVARFWLDPQERNVYGQALALVVGEEHLRLSL